MNKEKEIKKDLATISEGIIQNNDSKYVRLFYMRFPKIQTASGQLNLNLNYFKLLYEIPKNPNSVWTIESQP